MPQLRRILSCDGGGIRGIITLRCLEALEARVGPCNKYFDMFAGTSTGAIIAGSLARGLPVSKLIEIYTDRRPEMFPPRLFGFLHPLVTKYSKKGMRNMLREYVGDTTLAELNHDVLITAVDTVRSETVYFSSFLLPEGGAARYGSYQKVKLRDAIEASASAPTYFPAHGRFIDGGATVYNNPAYVAAVEALRYSSDRKHQPPQASRYDGAAVEVYSFSTGLSAREMEPGEAMRKSGLGWINYIIGESSNHAGYQQSYVSHSELDMVQGAIAFYRYDLYLNRENIDWWMPGSRIDPETLALDAVDDERFELLNELGKKYGASLFGPNFTAPAPPAAPSAAEQARIARDPRSARGKWDQQGRKKMEADYVDEVLAEFAALGR